jgi:hypothetical protein
MESTLQERERTSLSHLVGVVLIHQGFDLLGRLDRRTLRRAKVLAAKRNTSISGLLAAVCRFGQ